MDRLVWQEFKPDGAFVAFHATIQHATLAAMPADTDYLLTARVDNDDALGCSYFAVMEQYSRAVIEQSPSEDFWLSPPHGAQLADNAYRTYLHAYSHFLARCVSARRAREPGKVTVSSINHTKVFEEGRVVYLPLTDRPIWLQNVHGDNISNSAKVRFPHLAEPERVASWFGLT